MIHLILAKGTDSEKVQDVITSLSVQAPSPRDGLLDEIALALDGTSLVLANWFTLAIKLRVPRKICWEFERRSTESPTSRIFQYLAATCPEMTLTMLKEALVLMERKDLMNILEKERLGGNLCLSMLHMHIIIILIKQYLKLRVK